MRVFLGIFTVFFLVPFVADASWRVHCEYEIKILTLSELLSKSVDTAEIHFEILSGEKLDGSYSDCQESKTGLQIQNFQIFESDAYEELKVGDIITIEADWGDGGMPEYGWNHWYFPSQYIPQWRDPAFWKIFWRTLKRKVLSWFESDEAAVTLENDIRGHLKN